jgi:hypothetical protein
MAVIIKAIHMAMMTDIQNPKKSICRIVMEDLLPVTPDRPEDFPSSEGAGNPRGFIQLEYTIF